MKYSVNIVTKAAATIPYFGMKNKFNITLIIRPIKVIIIFILKKPSPLRITPVKLLKASPANPNDKILSTIMDPLNFSV